jgi:hypothetical protein
MAKVYALKTKDSDPERLPKPSKAKKESTYLSTEELIENSTVDFSKATTQKGRIELMQQVVVNSIPIAEGLYRSRPSQSNAYALSNLITQVKDLDEALMDMVDYEKIADAVQNDVINPFMEKLILELGRSIRVELSSLKGTLKQKDRAEVKASLSTIYRFFGDYIQKHSVNLEKKVLEVMTS